MRSVDFSALKRLHEAAAWAGVGFSVVYEEACDEWHTTIESAAPGERFISRTRSLETAIDNGARLARGAEGARRRVSEDAPRPVLKGVVKNLLHLMIVRGILRSMENKNTNIKTKLGARSLSIALFFRVKTQIDLPCMATGDALAEMSELAGNVNLLEFFSKAMRDEWTATRVFEMVAEAWARPGLMERGTGLSRAAWLELVG